MTMRSLDYRAIAAVMIRKCTLIGSLLGGDRRSARHAQQHAYCALGPPDADDVYANYLRTCAMLAVTPTPRERAIELIAEWTATMRAAQATKHYGETVAPIELYPFRFRDPRTGKWVRARYVATLAELKSRYREWEIIGPPETRGDAPVQMFQPEPSRMSSRPAEAGPDLAPAIDATEQFLLRVFLRRYVTYLARRQRWKQMQGAVRLFADC